LHTDPLQLAPGQEVRFVQRRDPGEPRELACSYATLIDEIDEGDQIVIGDGLVRLTVMEKTADEARCEVVNGGLIRSRQGMNLPGVSLGVPALLDRDRENAIWAAGNEIEFVSLSFVRKASEIRELQQLLHKHNSSAMVIAKIEKREALDELEDIIDAADAIMVARGDLGVEIEIEKTPLAQKRIIKTCSRMGKPVIVATQMLESMHTNRQPTRAEASDVANAILDGADACMLSGETAIGDFPLDAVTMMQKIQAETETALRGRPSRQLAPEIVEKQGITEAVVFGAALIARRVDAKLVVIATSDSKAAVAKSKQRNFIPTLGVTDRAAVVNRMCLLWGIAPVRMDSLELNSMRQWIDHWAQESEVLSSGDNIVFVADTEVTSGVHETVMVWKIP
ncbi:MAG: pyruvate kinase, partial [Pirellulaceae bacterium]